MIIRIIRIIENPVEENTQVMIENTIFNNLTILVNNQEITKETISLKNFLNKIKIETKIEMMAIKIKENHNAISDKINTIIVEIIKTNLTRLPLLLKKLNLIISDRKISKIKNTKINLSNERMKLKINTLKKFQTNKILIKEPTNIIRKKITRIIRTMIQAN